ncbi:Crp/Fnr family transcriptional regulator [Rhodoferax sp.]|uniref:Crp/Fnr family transcriptional regulator n=1 Tax=Rhodoferax sp. TaxID=50421 RepID=UPI00374DE587
MNSFLPADDKPDVRGLVDAIVVNKAQDGLPLNLAPAQWETLADYLNPLTLAQGSILFKQGALDRTLYFIASGSLSVHFEDADSRIRLAIVGAGSVVGEGSFFTGTPRSATVQASSICNLWSLSPMRFSELTHRKPELALAIAMSAGAVVAKRLMHSRYRIAVT